MALNGIKVLEIAGLAPAPFCGMLLAEFGASVIRIDKVRSFQDIDVLANGKRSLAVDLKTDKGTEIVKQLCSSSDVLIEPFRRGVMEKLGLGPDVLLKRNPQLIFARLTGFGQYGSCSGMAGHDINYLALSGVLSLLGRKNENPLPPVNLMADFAGGGLICALGIAMALYERTKSGKGQIIDASMVEGAAYVGSWLFRSQSIGIWENKRGENMLDSGTHFYEIYKTKDGKYIAVGAIEPQFYSQLLKGLNLSEETVPQYGNFDESKKILTERFLEKTQEEWCQIFDKTDACVTPVLSLEESSKYKHNMERKSFVSSQIPTPGPAPRLSRTPAESRAMLPLPVIGGNTEEILTDLNYTIDEIRNLEKDGVVLCAKLKTKL